MYCITFMNYSRDEEEPETRQVGLWLPQGTGSTWLFQTWSSGGSCHGSVGPILHPQPRSRCGKCFTGSQKASFGNFLCMRQACKRETMSWLSCSGTAHSRHPKPHCSERAAKTQGTGTASKTNQSLLHESPGFWDWWQGGPPWFKTLDPRCLEKPLWMLQTDLHR